MTLLSPLALGLLTVAVPVLLVHMLRTRRRERTVSSTFLWRHALQDVEAKVRLQRLRPNLLLLLQLLVLLALVLALAQPAYTETRALHGSLVVVIDQSMGMQTRDIRPSRFAQALRRAHALASRLAPGNVMSVIGMGAEPALAVVDSDDSAAVNRAINRLHATVEQPNVGAAVSLALSLVRGTAGGRLLVLTSRDSGAIRLPRRLSVPVEIDRIGRRLQDLALARFHAAHAGNHIAATLHVRNLGMDRGTSDLELRADNRLADVRPATVPRGADLIETWTHLPGTVRRLVAHLTRVDDRAADKTAYAVVPSPAVHHVQFVSRGDFFLQTALSLDGELSITPASPTTYSGSAAARADLVVFDGFLPRTLPSASVLIVNPPAGTVAIDGFDSAGAIRVGSLRRVRASLSEGSSPSIQSTLLRYVDLGDVHVARVRSLSTPAWVQPVVTASGMPLLAAGDDGSRRLAAVPFDLQESDWPLRVSFPVALSNLIQFLTPGLSLGARDVAAGQPLALYPGPGVSEIRISRPDGRIDRLRAPFAPFADTTEPGFYTARARGGPGGAPVAFAVNVPLARPAAPGTPPVQRLGPNQAKTTQEVTTHTSVAWALAVLALLLLSIESWYLFRR